MKYLLAQVLIIAIAGVVSSCRVVSTRDAKSIGELSGAIKVCATAPGEFVKQYYDLQIEIQKMRVASKEIDASLVGSLEEVVNSQRQEDSLLVGYNAAYNVLSGYADLLQVLINDTTIKSLKKSTAAFVSKFDTALVKYNSYTVGTKIPVTSIGEVVSKIITEAGNRGIKHLQRKYLLSLVNKGDSIVGMICDNYITIDHYRDSSTLGIDRKLMQTTFVAFMYDLQNDPGDANAYKRYKVYEPIYYNWSYKLDLLKALDHSNTAAFAKMKASHQQLRDALNKKITFSSFKAGLKELYGPVNAVDANLNKLQTTETLKK